MAKPRTYRREAVVLKSTPSVGSDLIVTVYTKEEGKLRGVVRGVRKPTSRMVGHLEPLNRVELALASSGRGGLDTVTQAQMLEGFPGVKANLEALARGIYVAELVDGFGVESGPNTRLYSLLVDTLHFLDESPQVDLGLRYFELSLLECSGFMPELYACVQCRTEIIPGEHSFSPEVGGILCSECRPPGIRIMGLSVQAVKVLRFLSRASLPELSSLVIHKNLHTELENLLSVSLRYWLDREIRSKTFMRHLENFRDTGLYVRNT